MSTVSVRARERERERERERDRDRDRQRETETETERETLKTDPLSVVSHYSPQPYQRADGSALQQTSEH